jgi:hypothetical protein
LDGETLSVIYFNRKARKDLRKVRKVFRQSFAVKNPVVLDVETLNAILFNRKKSAKVYAKFAQFLDKALRTLRFYKSQNNKKTLRALR